MEIIVATNNQGKLQEMQQGIYDSDISLVSYQKYLKLAEKPLETGQTYFENAYLKAKFYQAKLKQPVLADDGGLELVAFPEILGLKTQRFFKSSDPLDQNQEILALFQNTKISKTVTLKATLVYLLDESNYLTSEASLVGEIVPPKGTMGYGFDSIIKIPALNKTLAEMTDFERAHYSPRIQALKKILLKIKGD